MYNSTYTQANWFYTLIYEYGMEWVHTHTVSLEYINAQSKK